MNRFQYPVLLTAADEGGYVVTCRDLPQLVTQGETEQDALEQASDAMDEVFATYLIEGHSISPRQPRRGGGSISSLHRRRPWRRPRSMSQCGKRELARFSWPSDSVLMKRKFVVCSILTMDQSCRESQRPSACSDNAL